MKNIVVSTIGTSILTNYVRGDEEYKNMDNFLLYKSNSQKNDFTQKQLEYLEKIKNEILIKLRKESISEVKSRSAEIKSVLAFYEFNLPNKSEDLHYLIRSDTYLSEITAQIIESWLREHNLFSQTVKVDELDTSSRYRFVNGIKKMVEWCDKTLNSDNYSKIIFNLTGGFKSLQGMMNTIGMFYADKIIYIFESSDELIEIPKLPITIDNGIFKSKAKEFLQLSQDLYLHKGELLAIEPIFLQTVDNDVMFGLSEWGLLSWNKVKNEICKSELIEFNDIIEYDKDFRKDFADKSREQYKVKLQETIAKVYHILRKNNNDIAKLKQDGGLLYEEYKNKNNKNELPIGHFRVNQEVRVSCVKVKNGNLLLRHFGAHDYVNNNP